jgi:hypothetical protein
MVIAIHKESFRREFIYSYTVAFDNYAFPNINFGKQGEFRSQVSSALKFLHFT